MARVQLEDVSICFPLYDAWHRSLFGGFDVFGTLPRPMEGYRRPFTLALDKLRLELTPGMRVAVLGENGSGKSTLLRILAGLLEPTAGSVFIYGTPAAVLNVGYGFPARKPLIAWPMCWPSAAGMTRRISWVSRFADSTNATPCA